ncbi:ATP-binding protein [Neoaquamicrobium sediminum]|uniref:ATP-binding protein n=1 Tax=Neoaquamicrobium sediminum TaxID=1849104 RepID=UPI003BADA127
MTTPHRYFTVDSALLQELGERLIGRPHIAVAELIKNAYDADATTCEVVIEADRITISDNGEGMDESTFISRYLRLGTQHKRDAMTSRRLGRPLTGAKGVGRLATQFLGSALRIESCREDSTAPAIVANIDWAKIVGGEELARFPVYTNTKERTDIDAFPDGSRHGTRVVIENLRAELDDDDVKELGREVWLLRPPFNQFGGGRSRRDRNDPKNFEIRFLSENEDLESSFDEIFDDLTERVWRAKITGRIRNGRESDIGEIEIEFREGFPSKSPYEVFSDEVVLSRLKPLRASEREAERQPEAFRSPLLDAIDFTVYVYKLERKQSASVPLADLREYLSNFGNVSIYDSGFRLPYYGIESDWLLNGLDHARRVSVSSLLPSKWGIEKRYLLDLPAPGRIFGFVEINTSREERIAKEHGTKSGHWLEIQAGRDRLHDNAAYAQLQAFVRYGLDLYANRYAARSLRAAEVSADREPAERKYKRLVQVLEENRDQISDVVYGEAIKEAKEAERAAKSQDDQFTQRIAAIAPLAAAGMTALAMTHELNREVRFLRSAERRLRTLAKEHGLSDLMEEADGLRASLDRLRALQSLFSPLLSAEDREERARLRVEPVVRGVVSGMAPLTPGLEIETRIDEEMRFPPAPLAAWNALLQNVIANAWNACLASRSAKVEIVAFENVKEGVLWVSDTGVGIDLGDADRLFDAFERKLEVPREQASLAIGGQGLGLAIVRMLAETHKAEVAFVEPEDGYATTFQMKWRK